MTPPRPDHSVKQAELIERQPVELHVPGELHRCLRCGHAAHLVGRAVAECGRCGWPSPLAKETTLIHEKERLAARIEAKVAEIDREIAAAVPRDLRARREALILAQQTLKLEGVL